MGPLAKGLSSIIGLGTEAYAHQKDKRAASGQSSEPPSGQPPPYDSTYEQKGPSNELDEDSGSDYGSDEEDDELDWLRDDTQAQLEPARSQDGTEEQKTVDQITAEFTAHVRISKGTTRPDKSISSRRFSINCLMAGDLHMVAFRCPLFSLSDVPEASSAASFTHMLLHCTTAESIRRLGSTFSMGSRRLSTSR